MSNREIVIDLVGKLPEDTPLEEIARQIELLAGIRTAREQARRGEGVPAEDVRKLVDSWASV
jgi:predicted transcriptional regulator